MRRPHVLVWAPGRVAPRRYADWGKVLNLGKQDNERGFSMSLQHLETTSHFHDDLKALLPRLRIYALSLTRDSDRADDLVQQSVLKSLAGRASFKPGTNFAGWMFRIQRNEFISGLRRQRPSVTLDDPAVAVLSHPPRQESGLVMREFKKAFHALPTGQREALLLVGLEGHAYDTIAALTGVTVGTVKSRVSRGRAALRSALYEDTTVSGATVSDDSVQHASSDEAVAAA